MTDAERKELRALQNRWLGLPFIQRHIGLWGWNQRVNGNFPDQPPWPTFAEVRDLLHPDLKGWFQDFFREGE